MGYFQDMGLLFIYSLIVLLWKEPDRTLIFAILWAVILICGIYFIHGKSTKVLVCTVFALMALVVPEIEMFYPILIYALIKEINWQMGLTISMAGVILLGKYGNMHIEIMAKYVVGCLLAAILERKTYKYDKMDIELRKTVDSGEEKALLLSEKNKALAEKQNSEIYAATLRERNRIAREIHDTLGHTMTGLSAGIDACIALIDYSVDETKKQLSIISGVARQGLKDVRRSMKKLRPDTLERESLESAIEKLITETMSTSKVSIEFQSFLPSLVFEDDEEDTIYRIVQEGITNAIRHGHASRIFINFKKVDIWLVIRIRDNGIGCKDIHKGFGLTHMKERVDMLHGTVTYSSNNGFQVVAKLPIRWRNEER